MLPNLKEFGFSVPEIMEEIWIGLEDTEGPMPLEEWIRFDVEEDMWPLLAQDLHDKKSVDTLIDTGAEYDVGPDQSDMALVP